MKGIRNMDAPVDRSFTAAPRIVYYGPLDRHAAGSAHRGSSLDAEAPDREGQSALRTTLVRAGLISLALVVLAIGGVAAVGFFSADREHLPMEYDGFDEGPVEAR
jgi:hypothetical protein